MGTLARHIGTILLDGACPGSAAMRGRCHCAGRGAICRSTRGETITEVLISVAIGGLALIMLAMAIAASTSVATAGGANIEKYCDANTAIVQGSATSAGTGALVLTSGSGTGPVPLVDAGPDGSGDSIKVTWYENAQFDGSPVILYTAES